MAPLNHPDDAAACISATPPARLRLLMTTSDSRSGSRTLSVGDSSNPVPAAAGVHEGMSAPCGMYMNPVRIGLAASVFANAVAAGIIASSSGSASEAPMPRRNVRRGIESFEMNITPRQFHVVQAFRPARQADLKVCTTSVVVRLHPHLKR